MLYAKDCNCYIYHHLGLGDHIICNALVRNYTKIFGKTFLFCKPQNIQSVSDMYSDIEITLIEGDDNFVANFKPSEERPYSFIPIGFDQLNNQEPFDYQFYKLAGLNFKTRWESFYCPHNPKEDELFDSLNLPPKYALVHEDAERGYLLDHSEISLPIIELDKIQGFSLMNWRKVINNATEIHMIESSPLLLVDSLEDTGATLFDHRYARVNPWWQIQVLKKNWRVLN